jgi:hypothetical protein
LKFDSYSLKAAPSKYPPSKHQVSHALMSCLFDPDPDPDQIALCGQVTAWGIFSSLVEKTVAYSLSPGKGAALASAPLASSAGSP